MQCTSCKNGVLVPTQLEDQFPARRCTRCGGNWIYLYDYLRWLDQGGATSAQEGSYQVEAQETEQAMLCPKTGSLMLKYRISKDSSHLLDLSAEVSGIWLDKGEWDLLKSEGLATRLNAIFTEPWQKNIRSQTTRDVMQALYKEKFGVDGYEKIKAIRTWLSTSPNKAHLIAYLLAEDPYSTHG